jgi:hypothetical protein
MALRLILLLNNFPPHNLLHRRHYCQPILPVVLSLVIFLNGGCLSAKSRKIPTELAVPVLPTHWDNPTASVKFREFQQCLYNSSQTLPAGPVAEVLLTYVSAGRDFHAPQGPDGYVLRIIPLDKNYRPVRGAADVNIVLAAETSRKNGSTLSTPVCFWQISAQNLEAHWTTSHLLDSYLFRLEWGTHQPGPGDYRFLVSYAYKHKKLTKTICREITFNELTKRY